MSETIITAENLSKRYRIGIREKGYKTFREAIVDGFSAPLRNFRRLGRLTKFESGSSSEGKKINQNGLGADIIWALRDVSFEVKEGEVLGIIGRNGAGKSTLLKILSRITEPTAGDVKIYGRVSSLLEVGTGFHPELTGRENIYLNAAILGMRKTEIERKFDEIVAFAEIEKFIDTPVKRYSSGMYVRLAFAVAAHLEPEILLVDEVLSVGDINFQKKCIGKMEKVAAEGRTVLIVSHSMGTVKALCSRAILLESGSINANGPVDEVVSEYLTSNTVDGVEKLIRKEDHLTGVKKIQVKRIKLVNGLMNSFTVHWQQPISIRMEIEVLDRIDDLAFGAGIRTIEGTHIFHVHHDDDGVQPLWTLEPGTYSIEFTIQNNLRPGLYKFHVGADQGHISMKNVCGLNAVTLEVLGYAGNGLVPEPSNTGLVNGSSKWEAPKRLT